MIRRISQENLPVGTSFIPYDMLMFLYKAYADDRQINLKDFFIYFKHSQMGVRYHLKKLINDGWISLASNPVDRRSKLLVINPKFIDQMEKTLTEIGLNMQLEAFLSPNPSVLSAQDEVNQPDSNFLQHS